MNVPDPLQFTALDDGTGGIELQLDVDATFRDLAAGERRRRYRAWLEGLHERVRRLPRQSDERTGLELLVSVAEEVGVWMESDDRPPATMTLSVSSTGAAHTTAAMPPPHTH